MRLRTHANIPPGLAASHKYVPAATAGEFELHASVRDLLRLSALRVNLPPTQLKFSIAVTLISVKPLPHGLMYASYLNPIYPLRMTENNSCR